MHVKWRILLESESLEMRCCSWLAPIRLIYLYVITLTGLRVVLRLMRLQIRLYALNSLCRLIRISASPLRPLAQQLQSLSVILLCKWSEPSSNLPEGQKAAANLLGHVYITAGKAQAGNAWRKTIEGLVGSAHQCISPLVSTLIEGALLSSAKSGIA